MSHPTSKFDSSRDANHPAPRTLHSIDSIIGMAKNEVQRLLGHKAEPHEILIMLAHFVRDATVNRSPRGVSHAWPEAQLTMTVEALNAEIDRITERNKQRFLAYERQIGALKVERESLLDVLKVVYITLAQGMDSEDITQLEAGTSRAIAAADPEWNGLAPDNAEEVLAP